MASVCSSLSRLASGFTLQYIYFLSDWGGHPSEWALPKRTSPTHFQVGTKLLPFYVHTLRVTLEIYLLDFYVFELRPTLAQRPNTHPLQSWTILVFRRYLGFGLRYAKAKGVGRVSHQLKRRVSRILAIGCVFVDLTFPRIKKNWSRLFRHSFFARSFVKAAPILDAIDHIDHCVHFNATDCCQSSALCKINRTKDNKDILLAKTACFHAHTK